MNVPFTAVHFSAYETVKRLLAASADDEGLRVQLIAGGAAGGLSAAVTNPLDVLKTRLQTEGMLSHRRNLKSGAIVRLTEGFDVGSDKCVCLCPVCVGGLAQTAIHSDSGHADEAAV
jgi:Mitochondrial carrier protein